MMSWVQGPPCKDIGFREYKNIFSTRYAFSIFFLVKLNFSWFLINDGCSRDSGLSSSYYRQKFPSILMRSDLFIAGK